MISPLHQELRDRAVYHFEWNYERIAICIDQLAEADVWRKPNASSTSIGNQVLHLCGNITQYIISSLGQQTDHRNRDAEFSQTGGLTRAELLTRLADTTRQAVAVIQQITEAELLRVRPVQAFQYSGVAILIHATEHYSYHTGQIIFWTKQLLDKDLDLYAGLDLTAKG